jgi:hypothetical protein
MQSTFKKREIRVTTCGKRTKRTEKVRHEKVAEAQVDGTEAAGVKADRKSKPKVEASPKKHVGAARRIEVRSNCDWSVDVVTCHVQNKKKAFKASKAIKIASKNKKKPAKKAKKLGGVIKRAMKGESRKPRK